MSGELDRIYRVTHEQWVWDGRAVSIMDAIAQAIDWAAHVLHPCLGMLAVWDDGRCCLAEASSQGCMIDDECSDDMLVLRVRVRMLA